MVKVIFEMDSPFVLNNEVIVRECPVEVDWWRGQPMVVDLLTERFLLDLETDPYSIQISEKLFLVRKKLDLQVSPDSPLPFYFLSLVQQGQMAKARDLLSFDITESALREFFGEFEIILNNYLEDEKVFSILPNGERVAKNFRFDVEGIKITNIS
ncbi:MAG: hypothetical protein FWE31_00450 [Firmicutes bacterium]|nr:hypothetical protein [Bacillota bacterium]